MLFNEKNVRRGKNHAKYTVDPNTSYYMFWMCLVFFANFYTSLMYPYYTVNGMPDWISSWMILLVSTELICLFDIVINFILQEVDEEGRTKFEKASVLIERYFKGQFPYDLLVLLPIGYLMSLIDSKLKFFWVIKAFRITKVNYYLSDRMILPII